MKKIALVAALAAVAAPAAFAQSSVTMWGRLNTTVESTKDGNQQRKAVVNNNSSRLGMKGSEDLGGGLKASFALEHGFNSDTGTMSGASTNTFWNREASVQLSGSFGAVRLGKWTAGSYFATADYVSMHNHDTGTSSDALYSSKWVSTNKVGYFTPTVGGFSAEVAAHAGEGVDARAFDVSAYYDNGPLHLGFGYEKQGSYKQFAVRGLYELGAFTFGGYLQKEDTGRGTIAGVKDNRIIARAAVMYTMGASEFHLNVGGTKAGGDSFNKANALSNGRSGGKQWTLGYNYNLSKRTKVYGFYTAIDSTQAGVTKPGDFSSLAAGIRHNF